MSINRYRNLKKYILGYTKKLTSLVKIEVTRKRERQYPSGRKINAPINSSGSLRDSISFELKESDDKKYSFRVKGNSYAEIIDKGRKSGENAPSKADLVSWIERKKIRLRDRSGRFVDMTPQKIDLAARYMVTSIRKLGSPPTNFLQDAMDVASKRLDNVTLKTVLSEDVANNIEEILLDAGFKKQGDEFTIQ